MAPYCHLNGNGYFPESVLLRPPGVRLFWVPVNLCPSCGPGLSSHVCFNLSLTARWPLPQPPPDQPWLTCSKSGLVTRIQTCLYTFGDTHTADAQMVAEGPQLGHLAEGFEHLQSPNLHSATEHPCLVDKCLCQEAIFLKQKCKCLSLILNAHTGR